MAFNLKQKTDVAGDVDLEKLTLDSADGLDEGAQKANVAKIARVFNELLPSHPALRAVREQRRAGEGSRGCVAAG